MPGTLYVIATPIGNLEDLSARAARLLGEVDAIACEDTRQTHKLLGHLGISKPMVPYHEHNERERAAGLVARLQAGENVALVSDAGTPLISDPGYRLVEAAVAAGIEVVPIPGPNAGIAALSASGLPTDRVYFGGFLAARPAQRRRQLEEVKALSATLIFYETPHRIVDSLDDIAAVLGNRRVVLGRELTKLHEEFLRGTAAELRANLAARPSVKGEFTVLIEKGEPAVDDRPALEAVAAYEQAGMSRMDAIKQVAKERGVSKRDIYREVER